MNPGTPEPRNLGTYRLTLLASLTIVSAVAVIYREAIPAYFFEDDFQWLVSRWTFHPSDLLDLAHWNRFYRPVIELYFWISSPLFGESPAIFHLVNVLVHMANGLLLWAIAARLGFGRVFAFAAAMFFVVQPAYVGAVAWVGALAEPVSGCFGFTSIYAWLRFRSTGRTRFCVLSASGFGLALLTHESSVIFLPLLGIADWTAGSWPRGWRETARDYAPFALLTAAYLAVDMRVSANHFWTEDDGYGLGVHVVRNVFEYIEALYVGERNLLSHVLVTIVLAWVFVRGSKRAKFAALWMILATLPFAPFVVGNISRYAYLPAAGFALLLAEAIGALSRRWEENRTLPGRTVVLSVIAVFLTARFAVFAWKAVRGVAEGCERYRTYVTELRRTNPQPADGTVFTIDARTDRLMPVRYLESAVQWEFKNPTLRVVVVDR